jgi:uncharacterized surface protein with fasciclin (FAS1) repeats
MPAAPAAGTAGVAGAAGVAAGAGGGAVPPPGAPPTGPGGIPPENPWYRRGGPLTAVVVVGTALLFLLIAFLIWIFDDDDDDSIATTDSTTTSVVLESTTTTSSTIPATTTTTTSTPSTTTSSTTTTSTTTSTTVPETTTTAAATTTTTTIPEVTVPPQPGATLWDVILNSPDLSELRDLVELAGLDDELDDADATFTLFAPSNDAIELAEAGVGAPDFDDPDVVEPILLTHVHGDAALLAVDVLSLDEIEVLEGGPHAIDGDADPPTIGGAGFIVVDVVSANGVLHVINGVLQP